MIRGGATADAGARDAGRDGGARLGHDGDRRHDDGRRPWRQRDRRRRPGEHAVLRRRRVRDGPPARPRPARVAGVRRPAARRVPSLAGRRRVAERARHAADGRDRPRDERDAPSLGPSAGSPRPVAAVPRHPDVEPAAAAALRRVPALPPGDEHRPARDVRARRGEPRQRRRELDPDQRTLRRAGDGRARAPPSRRWPRGFSWPAGC